MTELLTGGSLHDALMVLRSYGSPAEGGAMLDEQSFLRVGGNIASGIKHLHNENLTHGDLKPHNVLLTSRVEVRDNGKSASFRPEVKAKLADFGLSRRTSDLLETANSTAFGPGPVGTFAYMSAECFDGIDVKDGDVACAADIFAFAVVMYELLCGRQPWVAENVRSVWTLHKYVCQEHRRPSWGPRKDIIRPEYIELVEKCWASDPALRPTSSQVAKQFHTWEAAFKQRKLSETGDVNNNSMTHPNQSGSMCEGPNGVVSDVENEFETPIPSPLDSAPQQNEGQGADNADGDQLDKDLANLGVDDQGNPYMRRVVTKHLNEAEAMLEIKHIIAPGRSPEDIGASTDTRMGGNSVIAAPNAKEEEQPSLKKPDEYELAFSCLGEDSVLELGHPVRRVISQPLGEAPAAPKLDALGLPGLPGLNIGAPNVAAPKMSIDKFAAVDQPEAKPPTKDLGGFLDASFLRAVDRANMNGETEPKKSTTDAASKLSPIVEHVNQATPVSSSQPFLMQQPPTLTISPPQLQPQPPMLNVGSSFVGPIQNPPQRPAWPGVMAPAQTSFPTMVSQVNIHSVLEAMQSSNPKQTLDMYWNAGHGHTVAKALLHCTRQSPPILTTPYHFDLLLDFVSRNNTLVLEYIQRNNNNRVAPGPYNPSITRDLCVAIGTMAKNSPNAVNKAKALIALPITLSSMHAFNEDAAVYSSCCYAMSQLLEINNRISDIHVRKDIGVWIVHAISWNLRMKLLSSLAYTATCAARNFMWLNEANTEAFLMEDKKLFTTPPLRKVLQSTQVYLKNDVVLESILGTLGNIAFFPRFRFQLVQERGVTFLCEILRQSWRRGNISVLCLAVLSCIASDPDAMREEEMTLVRSSLMSNDACGAIVQALRFSLAEQQSRGVNALRTMTESLAAISAICDFDDTTRSSMVDSDAVRFVTDAVRGFAITNVTLIHSSLRTNCALQMCEASLSLAKSPAGLKRLRDVQMSHLLKNIRTLFLRDEDVVAAADRAIQVL